MNKYRNKKIEIDGIIFDSQKEGRRYQDLKLFERVGRIKGLTLKPVYPIEVAGEKICKMIPDFEYFDTDLKKKVVEDVKSKATITSVYRIKKKLMKACYGIEVREV